MRYKLTYFTFLDDKRSFVNVDALLTRLAPVGTIYVACTESGGADYKHGGSGGGSSTTTTTTKGKKSGQEVSELLSKLVTVLESRNDISNNSNCDGDHHNASSSSTTAVHELPPLSKSKAISLADSVLRHLLGGETSDAYLAYRGDRHLAEEPLLQWAMGYFFSADPSYRNESDDDTSGIYGVESGTLSSHLALDRTASEAIHLLPPRSGSGAALLTGGNVGNNSLFGVLNHCKTKMGRCVVVL